MKHASLMNEADRAELSEMLDMRRFVRVRMTRLAGRLRQRAFRLRMKQELR